MGSTKRLEINSETKRRPEKLGNLSEEKLGQWAVINSLRYSCPVWYTKNVTTVNNEYVYKHKVQLAHVPTCD